MAGQGLVSSKGSLSDLKWVWEPVYISSTRILPASISNMYYWHLKQISTLLTMQQPEQILSWEIVRYYPQFGVKPSITHQRAKERRRVKGARESTNQEALTKGESSGQNNLKYHKSHKTCKHQLSSLVENKDWTKELRGWVQQSCFFACSACPPPTSTASPSSASPLPPSPLRETS